MQRAGQGTIEVVIIFAAMLLVLLVILQAIPGETTSLESVRQQQTAAGTVHLVVTTANDVYLAGDGAQRTIWVDLPDGYSASGSFIGSAGTVTNWGSSKVVDLRLMQTGDVFEISRAPICGSWPAAAGRYQVVVAYNGTAPAHVTVNASC
ncbi:MAG: hypothetical protein KGH63_00650 [Candidatus Micrarchaeota archaeon]|nr:hypothetical protein [Candidatus Micrarchaeota archaeon]